MNVRYGGDFSGILIPALIALQWYQPTKIITSFAEAIVIYSAARLILKLPIMANVTLEGGRKLLLFFNISFAWKMALGRSEEHTSELQSLMRNSYAVFCLKKKT